MDAEFQNPGGEVAERGPSSNKQPKSGAFFKSALISGWIAAVVAVVALLLVFVPVTFITKYVFSPDIHFQNIEGSMWKGEAEAYFQYDRVGAVSWDLDVLGLLGGDIALACTLENSILSLQGACNYEFDQLQASMKGTATTELINTYTLDYGLSFPGIIEIRSMDARSSDNNEMQLDRAIVEWQGGLVDLSAFLPNTQTFLGPVHAILTREGDAMTIVVTPIGRSDRIMTVLLDMSRGTAHISIYQNLLRYASVPRLQRSIAWIKNLGEEKIHEVTVQLF